MTKLLKQLIEIDLHALNHAQRKSDVSDATVGWHLEHSLIVLHEVIDSLKGSDAQLFKPKFSIGKWFVLISGIIPRGKVKAPQGVTPKHEPTIESLNEKLLLAKLKIQELKEVQPNQYLAHPLFGHLNAKQVKRFLAIHTEHHLKIVRDIV
jgi:hypothetical protein